MKCKVPKLVGKRLAPAKAALAKRHCRVGTVTRKFSRKRRKGRVLSQTPKRGQVLPEGSKVNLVVSRGRRR